MIGGQGQDGLGLKSVDYEFLPEGLAFLRRDTHSCRKVNNPEDIRLLWPRVDPPVGY